MVSIGSFTLDMELIPYILMILLYILGAIVSSTYRKFFAEQQYSGVTFPLENPIEEYLPNLTYSIILIMLMVSVALLSLSHILPGVLRWIVLGVGMIGGLLGFGLLYKDLEKNDAFIFVRHDRVVPYKWKDYNFYGKLSIFTLTFWLLLYVPETTFGLPDWFMASAIVGFFLLTLWKGYSYPPS